MKWRTIPQIAGQHSAVKLLRASAHSPLLGLLLGLAMSASSAFAQADAATTLPAAAAGTTSTQPADSLQLLPVRVTQVSGLVQVRSGPEEAWAPAKEGMELTMGAEFRTGPRSMVKLRIGDDQELVLDRLGVVKVLQAVRDGGKIRTELGMKYGRTQYQVEAGGAEHESTIYSPGSTLAVRGTTVVLYDQPPFTPLAMSLEGRALFRNARRQMVAFGDKKGGRNPTAVGSGNASSAEGALLATKVDPVLPAARTGAEQQLLLQDASLVGIAGVRQLAQLRDLQSSGEVHGSLFFDLTWQGSSDVDLFIRSPLGEFLASAPRPGKIVDPAAQEHVSSGGVFGGDVDGRSAGSGSEFAHWSGRFPSGTYRFGANYFTGSGPALVTVEVTQETPAGQSLLLSRRSAVIDAQQRTALFSVSAGSRDP